MGSIRGSIATFDGLVNNICSMLVNIELISSAVNLASSDEDNDDDEGEEADILSDDVIPSVCDIRARIRSELRRHEDEEAAAAHQSRNTSMSWPSFTRLANDEIACDAVGVSDTTCWVEVTACCICFYLSYTLYPIKVNLKSL